MCFVKLLQEKKTSVDVLSVRARRMLRLGRMRSAVAQDSSSRAYERNTCVGDMGQYRRRFLIDEALQRTPGVMSVRTSMVDPYLHSFTPDPGSTSRLCATREPAEEHDFHHAGLPWTPLGQPGQAPSRISTCSTRGLFAAIPQFTGRPILPRIGWCIPVALSSPQFTGSRWKNCSRGRLHEEAYRGRGKLTSKIR
jgi:hypothetical protein